VSTTPTRTASRSAPRPTARSSWSLTEGCIGPRTAAGAGRSRAAARRATTLFSSTRSSGRSIRATSTSTWVPRTTTSGLRRRGRHLAGRRLLRRLLLPGNPLDAH
jgi:hypothetical protein